MKQLLILGRQAELSIAELEAQIGADNISTFGDSVLLSESIDINRYGGVIKVCSVLHEGNSSHWQKTLINQTKKLAASLPPEKGKYSIGLSVYGVKESVKKLNALSLSLKKELKAAQISARSVPNRDNAMNAAQVLHNKLTGDRGVEMVVVINRDHLLIGRTTQVQDIEAYTLRDRSKPERDSKVGMLPPKLAQILINLGGMQQGRILDPFCGSGTLLIEAGLMGYSIYGSDISSRMVSASQTNVDWAKEKFDINSDVLIEAADARSHQWSQPIDLIASETYLGPPLTHHPSPVELKSIINEVDQLHREFLENLAPQISVGTKVVLAVPAWQHRSGKLTTLPIVDDLEKLGYNLVRFTHSSSELVYRRPQQIVARHILVLSRK